MPHIGDVHDVTDFMAQELQSPAQNIGIQKGTEVPDVRIVVDGRTTGIEGHRAIGIARLEGNLGSLQGVIDS